MVVFAALVDPLEVIPLPLKLFRLMGVSRLYREKIRLYGCMSYVMLFCFIPKLCLGYDTIAQGFRGIAELLFSQNTCLTMMLLPFKFDKFSQLIEELTICTKTVCGDEDYRSILVHLNTMIHKFTKYYFLFTVFIVLAMYTSTISGILFMYYQSGINDQPLPLVLEYRLYGLDVHKNIMHCFAHLLILAPTITVLLFAFTAKAGVLFGLIRHCTTILHIIRLKIDRLNHIGNREKFGSELRQIIQLHQRALKCTDLLEDILMYILLAQFTGCVLIWCCSLYFVMYSGITADGITAVAMVSSFSVETFIFCVFGQELTRKGEAISEAIYATKWYEQPVHIQKMILPIIQKAHRRVGIKAAKFYYVDVNRYGRNLRTAYSFYLLLKDIF
ncbi:odorant receptor 94a-like [Anopheles albimanus]|uniref:Uncharacterized protein n=1 Tax=Anopheles albimanus TaxID=7167 RepID=A0A182G0E1_ANOAL|nr:odorant receptor 94a-like [Anopheles albimanus]